jgi:hypothetical protein
MLFRPETATVEDNGYQGTLPPLLSVHRPLMYPLSHPPTTHHPLPKPLQYNRNTHGPHNSVDQDRPNGDQELFFAQQGGGRMVCNLGDSVLISIDDDVDSDHSQQPNLSTSDHCEPQKESGGYSIFQRERVVSGETIFSGAKLIRT